MQAASWSALASKMVRTGAFGITRVCPSHLGMMSMSAKVSASS
jgi:hypothetical protein